MRLLSTPTTSGSGVTLWGAGQPRARRLPIALSAAGLVNIGMSYSTWYAGDHGAGDELLESMMPHLRQLLVGRGLLSDAEFDAAQALFDDPSFVDVASATISAWGQLPGDPARSRTGWSKEPSSGARRWSGSGAISFGAGPAEELTPPRPPPPPASA